VVFTNVMLPMQVNRKKVEDFVNLFVSRVKSTDEKCYWDQKLNEPLLKIVHHKTHQWQDIDKAVVYLRTLPFFKRLTNNKLSADKWRNIIHNTSITVRKLTDIVFYEEGYVNIVLNGRVVLRMHEQDPLDYTNIA
jgi:hypothetical protein